MHNNMFPSNTRGAAVFCVRSTARPPPPAALSPTWMDGPLSQSVVQPGFDAQLGLPACVCAADTDRTLKGPAQCRAAQRLPFLLVPLCRPPTSPFFFFQMEKEKK